MFLPCPLVVTIHDLTPFFLSTRSWLKQLFAVPLVKAGYRATAFRASHIITDSMNTARDVQDVLKIPPDRITPVHLAAAERHFHPRESGSDPAEAEFILAKYSVRRPFILVSSAENWRIKNLQTALRALAITRQLSPTDFETVIYGPSNGIEALTASQPSLARNIRNVGYVPTEDLAALFRNAELFITSSLYEGFGLPILEAMSCGCPVVTSNGGSLAEVAGKGAQVFDPMDAEGMAGAVAELLSDSGARLRWSKRAQDRAREFSWRKTAEQTLAVYCHVLGRQTTFHSDFAHCYDDQNARAQKSA